MLTALSLLGALALVFANGFFVAAEFALAKVRPTSLESLAEKGDRRAARALRLYKQLDVYLTVSQIGITFASLGLGWLGERALGPLLHGPLTALGAGPRLAEGLSFAIGFGVLSFLHIVVGEQVPKLLAIKRTEDTALFSALPMHASFYLFYPAMWLLNTSSGIVLRALGLPSEEYSEGALSAEELRLLIRATVKGGELDEKQQELLERVLRGTDKSVRSIMVPRVDLVTLSLRDGIERSIAHVQKHGFSRYPVSDDGNADHITGYVYVKDLLLATSPPRDGLRALKRDVLFVPESRTVGELLSDFQRTKIPIAIVVDEYGGTSGLVTLEDCVEEIVGEIQDELDVEAARVQTREDGCIVVDGSLPTAELHSLEGLVMPELVGGDTVGGYLVTTLGRLAHPGDQVKLGAYVAVVEDVRRRRVGRVAFRPYSPTMPPPPPEPPTSDDSEPGSP